MFFHLLINLENAAAVKVVARHSQRQAHARQVFSSRGHAWLQQGELEKALADLNRAVELDPKLADAYAHRGLVHAALDETEAAIADFDRALQHKSQLIYTRFNRGLALLRLGRYAEAQRDFAQFRQRLQAAGVAVDSPQGAFYLFPDFTSHAA